MASVTKQVQVGQKVSVTDLESGCRLTIVDGTESALTVVESAPDYVVLEDAAGDVKTRIPAFLIRGITVPMTEAPAAVVEETAPPMPATDVEATALPMVAPAVVETPTESIVPMEAPVVVAEAA